MAIEHLRNVMTGEIRPVETNSDEYVDLINEVYDHAGSARPKWEITGRHHTSRIDADEIQEEDFGYENKPLPGAEVGIDELGPEAHPERALTDAEVEAGIESWEQKADELGFRPRQNSQAVEELEPVAPEDREERGRQMAGSVGGEKKASRSGKGKSGGGTSGGGTTSGETSTPPSSPSSSSGSSSGGTQSGGSKS